MCEEEQLDVTIVYTENNYQRIETYTMCCACYELLWEKARHKNYEITALE